MLIIIIIKKYSSFTEILLQFSSKLLSLANEHSLLWYFSNPVATHTFCNGLFSP